MKKKTVVLMFYFFSLAFYLDVSNAYCEDIKSRFSGTGTASVGGEEYNTDIESEVTVHPDGSYEGSTTIDGETQYYDSVSDVANYGN